MTDIILYQGETSPSDVKLRGPTAVPRSTSIVVPVIDNGTAPTGPVVYYQSRFEPLPPIVAAVAYTVLYLQPLSLAPPVAKVQQGNSFVPFNTFQVNTQTIDKWQSPLSIPLPVAKALPGNSFVPFDTFQINTQRIDKWLVPLSKPVPVAQAQQGNAFVPLNTFQINTSTVDKWQQPLSIAVPVNKAQQGNSFVPFNTAQVSVNFTPFDWHQALSVAAPVAKTVAVWSFVPFNTTQPQDIEGMAWWMPLGVVPLSVVYQPQQFALAALQFGEIAPSPSVEGPTVGGTRRRHHVPGGRHFTRKEWEELQREIATERTALLAQQKFERDEKLRLKREAQEARVAKILAKAAAVDKQRAEALALKAEADAKAEAEFLAAMLAEIANQEDEDEVMMLLLGL